MTFQILVAAMNSDARTLAEKMNISSDAIIINQCDRYDFQSLQHKGNVIDFYSFQERGVGLSRNNALLRADHDISLFSDCDIIFYDDYEKKVCDEFASHPEADLIFFNFDVCDERRTYHTEHFKKVSWFNCGRYPTFAMAVRTAKIHANNITFSLLFGGGAKYSNGEDSLFIQDCLKKGLKAYASDVTLGREEDTPSTWFHGYNEKFFTDRGVLYSHLYGRMALPFAYRFLLKHKSIFNESISKKDAWRFIRQGIQIGKEEM